MESLAYPWICYPLATIVARALLTSIYLSIKVGVLLAIKFCYQYKQTPTPNVKIFLYPLKLIPKPWRK
jgi:hypothetical protein